MDLEQIFANFSDEEIELEKRDLQAIQDQLKAYDMAASSDLSELGSIYYSSRNDVIWLAQWAFDELCRRRDEK